MWIAQMYLTGEAKWINLGWCLHLPDLYSSNRIF